MDDNCAFKAENWTETKDRYDPLNHLICTVVDSSSYTLETNGASAAKYAEVIYNKTSSAPKCTENTFTVIQEKITDVLRASNIAQNNKSNNTLMLVSLIPLPVP